jgi:hypothetical protein
MLITGRCLAHRFPAGGLKVVYDLTSIAASVFSNRPKNSYHSVRKQTCLERVGYAALPANVKPGGFDAPPFIMVQDIFMSRTRPTMCWMSLMVSDQYLYSIEFDRCNRLVQIAKSFLLPTGREYRWHFFA